MALGDFLAGTTTVDLSGVTDHRLVFFLGEESLRPNGHPSSVGDDPTTLLNAWDWAIEMSEVFVDGRGRSLDLFLTTYVLPVGDQVFLVGHSVGDAYDGLVRLMGDREYGDRVCLLVQQHWPVTWHLLNKGSGMADGLGLLKVRTGQDAWFVGAVLTSRSSHGVELDQGEVDQVRQLAVSLAEEKLGQLSELPGLVDVLATDRRGSALKAAATIFSSSATVLENLGRLLPK